MMANQSLHRPVHWLHRLAHWAILAPGLFCLAGFAPAAEIKVVASFSILADLVREVGGERVDVHALVGPDEDAHVYEPRPSDARRIGQARLVVVNGLGFDDRLARLAESSGRRDALVVASQGIAPRTANDSTHGDHDDHGAHSALDPHAWQDAANVERYVANIAAALERADPAGAPLYRANAERYRNELKALDGEIRRAISSLPATRRRVVSSHDAFGYFSHAYGLVFLAPAGVAREAEPTAKEVARLITQLRAEKAAAVFMENITDPRLIERIRAESGAALGGTLYSDALSAADGPASSYLKMMRHNLDTLMTALSATTSTP
jgi:zinc/manganese transport system substrate-binding protein